MYDTTRKGRVLTSAILGLVGLAFCGTIWAWVVAEGCGSCRAAGPIIGGGALAPLGVGFYGGLLLFGLVLRRARVFYVGLLGAASVHLVLLLVLYQHGVFCGPCILVGGSAILAAGLSLWADPDNLAGGSIILPLGAVIAQGALLAVGYLPPSSVTQQRLAESARLPQSLEESIPGTARLLVFTRAGCGFCDEFEEDILPELVREFSDRLEVSRESAPTSLPTPTIVISGEVRSVFPGLPPISDLRDAILRALGEKSHESSMLPKPR